MEERKGEREWKKGKRKEKGEGKRKEKGKGKRTSSIPDLILFLILLNGSKI